MSRLATNLHMSDEDRRWLKQRCDQTALLLLCMESDSAKPYERLLRDRYTAQAAG